MTPTKLWHRSFSALILLAIILLVWNPPAKLKSGIKLLLRESATVRVNSGWEKLSFPQHAICNLSPKEIAELYAKTEEGMRAPLKSYKKTTDGALRIIGTGHSFMRPGYKTLPSIAHAAGFKQPPLFTHTGGGVTGSARYKWEEENGIYGFEEKPVPKLLASIANSEWDLMMWGPYFRDRPAYYLCWMDFCLKYNPQMRFYLSDAWPQLGQFGAIPSSETQIPFESIAKKGRERNALFQKLINSLNRSYPGKAFILPTSDAMVLAVKYYKQGKLPGVQGLHQLIGNKKRSLWKDRLGHLGPGFGDLEGYVFYSTLYGRSPELIKSDFRPDMNQSFPSKELDQVFREIAWIAVTQNPLSGVTDKDNNGLAD